MISIIVLTFGTEKYIEETIISFIDQTNTSFEVIFMAHKKDVKVLEVLDRYTKDYSFMKTIVSEEDHGPGNDRNIGIKESTYPYIHFIDGDDMLYPTFIEDYTEFINNNPHIDIFSGGTLYFQDSIWHKIHTHPQIKKIDLITQDKSSKYMPWTINTVTYHAKVYKKSFLISRELFFPNFMIMYDDFIHFQIIYFQKDPVSFLLVDKNSFYTLYRNREGSTVNNPLKGMNYYMPLYNCVMDYQKRTNNLQINTIFYLQYIYSFSYTFSQAVVNNLSKQEFFQMQLLKDEWINKVISKDIMINLKDSFTYNIKEYIILSQKNFYNYIYIWPMSIMKRIKYILKSLSFLRPSFYLIMIYALLIFNKKLLSKFLKINNKLLDKFFYLFVKKLD